MMDELELLKKDWQKKEEHLPKLTFDQIHKMLWKKSSSIVKWIFIISILEFTLPHIIYLFPSMRKSLDIYSQLGLKNIMIGLSVVQYSVVFYFIYLFYKRYKEISVLDSSKNLMDKILKTRRTVKRYVLFCLSIILVSFIMAIISIYLSDSIFDVFPIPENKDISPEKYKSIFLWSMGIISVVVVLFLGGIYFLLYGLLLRKLNKNYKELKQLEV